MHHLASGAHVRKVIDRANARSETGQKAPTSGTASEQEKKENDEKRRVEEKKEKERRVEETKEEKVRQCKICFEATDVTGKELAARIKRIKKDKLVHSETVDSR